MEPPTLRTASPQRKRPQGQGVGLLSQRQLQGKKASMDEAASMSSFSFLKDNLSNVFNIFNSFAGNVPHHRGLPVLRGEPPEAANVVDEGPLLRGREAQGEAVGGSRQIQNSVSLVF